MADLEELAARRRAALMDKQQKRMRFTRALNRSPLACATRLSVPAQNLSSSEVAGLHWLSKFALLPTNGGRHSVEDGHRHVTASASQFARVALAPHRALAPETYALPSIDKWRRAHTLPFVHHAGKTRSARR